MGKIFIAASLILGINLGINAQNVQFGAITGINFSTLTNNNNNDINRRTSFHIGGVAEIYMSNKFSFQPELLYSSQGSKRVLSEPDYREEYVVKLDYLYLPLIAKYYIVDGFSIEAGPQIGILLSAKEIYIETDEENKESTFSDDIKNFVNGKDFGLNFGLGYKMDNGLNFGVRYNLGLSDIHDYEGSKVKAKNSVFQVSVGYFFNQRLRFLH